MSKGIVGRLGRLGSLVVAGVVTSAVIAAIAVGASSGNKSTASAKAKIEPVGSLQLGSTLTTLGPALPILAYSWGVSNSGTSHTGGGGSAGKANVQDLSFTRAMDSTTVDLLKKVTQGTHYGAAVVIATSNSSGATMKYELEDVLVTAVSLGGSGSEKEPTENVTLNFSKVKWIYTDAAGVATSGQFNMVTNTP